MDDYFALLKQYHEHGGQAPALATSAEGLDGIVRDIEVFFDGPVLAMMLRDPQSFRKELNAVRKYGYQGRSCGGQNGICALRNADTIMEDKLATYQCSQEGRNLLARHRLRDPSFVKIVVHKPSGERVIGFYDQQAGRMLFTHQCAYSK